MYIYAVPHINDKTDLYDLGNSNSDNLLKVLRQLMDMNSSKRITVFVEYYDQKRESVIKSLLENKKNTNVKIIPLKSHTSENGMVKSTYRRLINFVKRAKCRIWITDTPYCYFPEKMRSQECICLGYCTPLKKVKNINDVLSFRFLDCFVQPSLLTASHYSSDFQLPLRRFQILGFPRNDTLFFSDRHEAVVSWINKKCKTNYSNIIVYAPTYRDYDGAFEGKNVLGYLDETDELSNFLESRNILLIYKMHPLQKYSQTSNSSRIIEYEKTYDFSLYDILSVSDMLISDYSSVLHDFIITGKPVVHNFFDKEAYSGTRGFAFEPIELVCPGPVASTQKELFFYIDTLLNKFEPSRKYTDVQKMFHKYVDCHSCERIVDYILSRI